MASDSDEGFSSSNDAGVITEKDRVRDHLQSAISDIRSNNTSFATFNQCNTMSLPGLFVEGLGHVDVPISPEVANRLLAYGIQAPFGKRDQTVIDSTIRLTKEIDNSKVRFENSAWNEFLTGVAASASSALGVFTDQIRAEFYKMLIYDKDCHFKAHRE